MAKNNNIPEDSEQDRLVDDAIKTLKNEYLVVGKRRIKPWHAWLIIGILVGVAAGILLIALRSRELVY